MIEGVMSFEPSQAIPPKGFRNVSASTPAGGDFAELLGGAPRTAGGDTAPPQGLYLESVSY